MNRFLLLFVFIGALACGGGGGGAPASAPVSLSLKVEPVVSGLNLPAGLAVAPDGRLFFSELGTGKIRIAVGGEVVPVPFATLDAPTGLEGTLGIALDREFSSNGFLYVFTAGGSPLKNKVLRFRDVNGLGTEPVLIADEIPNGGHNGGKIVSAGDVLYISTGDAGFPANAQSLSSLGGKILRVNRDGSIPSANPFTGSSIFALGFRNVFGLALNPISGKLFASDNGPDCDDEINLVEAGKNYGWRPAQPCGDKDPTFVAPLETINPPLGISGIAFYRGEMFPELSDRLLIGDFNTGSIRQYLLDAESGTPRDAGVLIAGSGKGILEIAVGPDGTIYFSAVDGIYRLARL